MNRPGTRSRRRFLAAFCAPAKVAREERVLRFGPTDRVDSGEIEKKLLAAVTEFISNDGRDATDATRR